MPNSEYDILRVEFQQMEERLSSDIKENRRNIQANSENISELKVLYKTLSDLPETMSSLDKTIVKVCDRLDNIDENMKAMNESIQNAMSHNKKQDKEIQRIDEKSKVDWASFVTENFWKVLLGIGVVYYIVRDMIH